MDQIKTFGENLSCREVLIDKIWGLLIVLCCQMRQVLLIFRQQADCPNEVYFLAKRIVKGLRDSPYRF